MQERASKREWPGQDAREDANAAAVATAFRQARLSGDLLRDFPARFPASLAEAYAIQTRAIADFPDQVRGWKIAGILPEFRETLGAVRLAGPVFAGGIRHADGKTADGKTPVPFPVFAGGFAGLEAEFIFRMARDIAPGERPDATALAAAVAALHAGVETAGSPLASINDLGPLAVIADFGNNNGLIVGPEVPGWRALALEAITSRTRINGALVGEGSAAKVAGGPLAALEFLVEHLAHRGMTLQAGDYVSTGMTTGIHAVVPGDRAAFEFVGGIAIAAEAVLAKPA